MQNPVSDNKMHDGPQMPLLGLGQVTVNLTYMYVYKATTKREYTRTNNIISDNAIFTHYLYLEDLF